MGKHGECFANGTDTTFHSELSQRTGFIGKGNTGPNVTIRALAVFEVGRVQISARRIFVLIEVVVNPAVRILG